MEEGKDERAVKVGNIAEDTAPTGMMRGASDLLALNFIFRLWERGNGYLLKSLKKTLTTCSSVKRVESLELSVDET